MNKRSDDTLGRAQAFLVASSHTHTQSHTHIGIYTHMARRDFSSMSGNQREREKDKTRAQQQQQQPPSRVCMCTMHTPIVLILYVRYVICSRFFFQSEKMLSHRVQKVGAGVDIVSRPNSPS